MSRPSAKLSRQVVYLAQSTDWKTVLRYLAILLLFVGIFYLAKGLYGYFTPPVDRAEVHVSMSFDYNGSLADLLSLKSTDTFTFRELNAYVVSITRYDASAAPPIGVKESSWPQCSDGLIITLVLDDHPYGPYCYNPSLLSSAFWTGKTSVDFTLITSPGPHSLKVIVTYKSQPIATKTINFNVPTYDEAVKSEGGASREQ